jgi:hypothetical protein
MEAFAIGMFIGVMGIISVIMGIRVACNVDMERVRENRPFRESQGDYQYRG